jgi:hypothetical protein
MRETKFWTRFLRGIGCLALIVAASASMAFSQGTTTISDNCETNVIGQPITLACANQFAIMCNAPSPIGHCNASVASTGTYGAGLTVSGPQASVGGVYCNLGFGLGDTSITGDVLASGYNFTNTPVGISGLPANSVKGECASDSGSNITRAGACADGQDTTGTNPLLAPSPPPPVPPSGGPLYNATLDEENFETALEKCVTPTSAAAIKIANGASQTIETTVSGGLTVIQVPSISVGNNAALILSGGPSDQLILETPGSIQLGTNARIELAGGLSAANVMLSASSDPTEDPGSNSTIQVGAGSSLEGLVHAEGGCNIGANTSVSGSLICDFGTDIGANVNVYHIPNNIALPYCGFNTDCGFSSY